MKNSELLKIKGHRPISLPDTPWVMQQTWKDLLFLHYKLPYRLLRKFVPSGLELDLYKGECWISIAPFKMRRVRVRWLPPIPTTYNFLELNLRTYVNYNGRPGVYFFSLDSSSTIASIAARAAFLPYFRADMNIRHHHNRFYFESNRKGNNKAPAELKLTYWPEDKKFLPIKGTLTHWLVERYCLIQQTKAKKVITIDIHHLPWQLHTASAEIHKNSLTKSMGFTIPDQQPIIQFAKHQKVLIWPLRFLS